jgi:hypothetical protein
VGIDLDIVGTAGNLDGEPDCGLSPRQPVGARRRPRRHRVPRHRHPGLHHQPGPGAAGPAPRLPDRSARQRVDRLRGHHRRARRRRLLRGHRHRRIERHRRRQPPLPRLQGLVLPGVGWQVDTGRNAFVGCEAQDTAGHGWRITRRPQHVHQLVHRHRRDGRRGWFAGQPTASRSNPRPSWPSWAAWRSTARPGRRSGPAALRLRRARGPHRRGLLVAPIGMGQRRRPHQRPVADRSAQASDWVARTGRPEGSL